MARPEPMNAMPRHSKAKVSLSFPDTVFVAGGYLTGKMELECKAERGLGISDIKVELFAIQELTSKYHSATSTFLHLTRFFQGPGLPPSNAVHAYPSESDDETLPVDYYTARKGVTTFFFRFPLPYSTPASIDFSKGLAKLKYEVRASAGISWRNERQRIMERQEVKVAEIPKGTSDSIHTVVGENGKIWVQGRVINPFVVAGRDVCIELLAKNHSNLRNSDLTLNLIQHLCLPNITEAHNTLQLSNVLLSVPFKGPEYIVEPGTEGVANLVFTVPKNASSMRPGRMNSGDEDDGPREIESLFSVECKIEIKFDMGFGNKDITLELPISVTHPISMSSYADQLSPVGNIPRSISSSPNISSAQASPRLGYEANMFAPMYMSPPISPAPYLPHQPWLQTPPPQHVLQNPYFSSLSPPPLPQGYLIRSSSADPYVAQQLPISLLIQYDQPSPTVDPDTSQASILPVLNNLEPEVGKGERASRISAHLRLSSRNRSVSPQSHRFPVNAMATVSGSPGTSKIKQLQLAQPVTAYSPTQQSDSHNESDAQLLSPRPILIHKQSFTIDHGTMKSDRVLDLERMAAEERPKDVKKGHERDKTLPSPPSVSESDISRKDFPPEPTLSPLIVRTRPDIWNRESGLAALEEKLLEQVGTRKMDPQRHADVRTVMPITIPASNGAKYEPLNDSAISSLALGTDSSVLAPQMQTLEVGHSENDLATSMNPIGASSEGNSIHITTRDSKEKDKEKEKKSEASKLRKAATNRVAAWLGGISLASPPPTDPTPPVVDNPISPITRMSPSVEVGTHPLLRSSPVRIAPTVTGPTEDAIPRRSSGFVLQVAKDSSSTFIPQDEFLDHPQTPTIKTVNAAESLPPASPVVNNQTPPVKPVLRRLLDRPDHNLQNPATKYDIRSARGGRGGKVTSVVALWSSLSPNQSITPNPKQEDPPRKSGAFSPQLTRPRPSHEPANQHRQQREALNRKGKRSHTHETADKNTDNDNTHVHVNVADLTTRRAKLIKSSSVPAILSSSLATPILSSTASLARPINHHNHHNHQHDHHHQQSYPKQSYPQTPVMQPSTSSKAELSIPDTPRQAPVKTSAVGELAFGQARLKDLIKKYQQGFGQ